jgi:hypothetical protein
LPVCRVENAGFDATDLLVIAGMVSRKKPEEGVSSKVWE